MKNGIAVGVGLVLAFIVQTAVLPACGVMSIAPDLIFALIIPAALLWQPVPVALMGAAAGLLLDIFFGHGIGLYALPYLGATWLIGRYARQMFNENALMPAAFAGAAFLAREIFTLLAIYLARMEIDITAAYVLRSLASALLTAGLSVPLYLLSFLFVNRRDNRRSGVYHVGR